MSTFEELELPPELVEILAAEGLEVPTALQAALIPVVRRGNNVVALAGPGSGIVAAYAAPLLERIAAEGDGPGVLILAPTAERAAGLADSIGRMAVATGHRVAALGGLWVLPERARVLVGTPEAVRQRVTGGHLSLESVEAVVVDGASAMAAAEALDPVAGLLEGLRPDTQRVVVALPLTPEVETLVEAHVRRSVHVPPRTGTSAQSPHRGDLKVVEFEGAREDAALRAVAHLLLEARHVAVFVRGEDTAADLGDFLSLRGYLSGRPGDGDAPVWLAVGGLDARHEMDAADTDDVAVLSVDVPGDADALDRRHGGGRGGMVLALARELPHLKAVAREAGYGVHPGTLPEPGASPSSLSQLMAALEAAVGEEDVDAYRLLLEPLFERYGPAATAGAAMALLRRRLPVADTPSPGPPGIEGFVRLFVSVGKRDGVRPGDLVGAITGEARVEAEQVGRIDLRESFCLVEVEQRVAQRVIDALNGTSIRGRAARVDYHREDRGGSRGGGSGRDSAGGRSGGSARDSAGGRGGGKPRRRVRPPGDRD